MKLPAALALVFGLAAAAPAAAAAPVVLDYSVYLGGVRVLDARLDLRMNAADYSVGLSAEPRGVVSWFKRWRYDARTDGSIGGVLQPAAFQTVKSESDGRDTRTVTFLGDGTTRIEDEPPRRHPAQSLPASQLAGAIDPLSALVAMARSLSAGQGCPARLAIWDGSHRFDLEFADLGDQSITARGVRGYSGTARRCRGQLVPVAGDFDDSDSDSFWRRPDPREDPRLRQIDFWLAAPVAGAPPVLVRAEGLTSLGPLIIHLTGAAAG